MENSIPDYSGTGIPGKSQENSIPIFGNGNASGKFHSRLLGREFEAGIPGNSREREFLLTPADNGPTECGLEFWKQNLQLWPCLLL